MRFLLISGTFGAVGTVGAFAGAVVCLLRKAGVMSRPRSYQIGAAIWRLVAKAVLTVSRVKIEGSASMPAGTLIVANHRSWLDPLVFAQLGPCTFVAKSEIRRWPVSGLLARVLPLVTLRKGDGIQLATMVSATGHFLERGLSVVAFPEGTTSPPSSLHEFAPAIFQAAIDTGRPVDAVSVRYESLDDVPCDLSWGEEPLWRNCLRISRQRHGIRSRCRIVLALRPPHIEDRRSMAERCCSAVAGDLGVPITRHARGFLEFCALVGPALRSQRTLTTETRIAALEWDSLKLVQLAVELEKQGVVVSVDDLFTATTVGELHERLLERSDPMIPRAAAVDGGWVPPIERMISTAQPGRRSGRQQ